MKRIFVPTRTGSDWHRLLAKPDLHWKSGRSAMTAAACWDAAGDCLPPDISKMLSGCDAPELQDLRLLAAIPEWEVPLPGGSRSSFTDILAVTRNDRGLCAIAVEAKAGEDFGPTLAAKSADPSPGQAKRLAYLQILLGTSFDGGVRYQLLHRTASAVLTARDFHAATAVMLVQAWKSSPEQRRDFEVFVDAVGAVRCGPGVWAVGRVSQPKLLLAWCDGDPRFLHFTLTPGSM